MNIIRCDPVAVRGLGPGLGPGLEMLPPTHTEVCSRAIGANQELDDYRYGIAAARPSLPQLGL